jgi:AbrB family looped-hinge helix DNA binding protein
MDAFISKVTSRGQVTIPQELREKEGITENDYVVMRKVGRYIVLGKAELRLDEITGAFEKEAKTKGITKQDLMSELESVRKSRK